VLLVLPEMDILRSEGEAMAAKLAAAGVLVQTEVILGMVHGFLRACGTVLSQTVQRSVVAAFWGWLGCGHSSSVAP
jgi:acetyl esterase/lipase